MNDLLLSELKSDEKDLLQILVLLEDSIIDKSDMPVGTYFKECKQGGNLEALETIIKQCQAITEEIESPLERAEHLLNELFYQHLFIDGYRANWPVEAFKVESGLNNRLMSPVIKAAILCEIITACGFDTDLVFVPNKIMVRICCDEKYAIIFDAITGESLNWFELDIRLDELDGDPSQHELPTMEQQAILVEHLTAFKNALISEQSFDKALKCVDIILSLTPDDPLQRRERGFLLHQLDCFKVAVDDYRYFVEQCPSDPAAKLLKIQLDNITTIDTVLH